MARIFKMNGLNTPAVLLTLSKYGLLYMPEAHTYLRYNDGIIDATHSKSRASDFIEDLIEEIEIEIDANQVGDFKTALP